MCAHHMTIEPLVALCVALSQRYGVHNSAARADHVNGNEENGAYGVPVHSNVRRCILGGHCWQGTVFSELISMTCRGSCVIIHAMQ